MSSQCPAALNPFSRPIRIVYPATEVQSHVSLSKVYLRQHWNKIVVAMVAGILAGFLAGAVSSRGNPPLTQVVYAASAAADQPALAAQPENTANQVSAREVSQLRAENEHLQALVEQLQKAHPPARTYRAKSHRRRRAHS